MGWNPQVLFAAFKGAGMLKQAIYKPAGVATPFDCDFKRPELLLMGDQQQSAEFVIEYETVGVPRIRKGDPVQVDGTVYTARTHATTVGDGTYSQAQLQA